MNFFDKRRAMRSQSGFTLIELLVVIAILGILAGVVVFAIGGVTENGQVAACKLEARTIKTAVQSFRAEESRYPYQDSDLFGGKFLEAPNAAALELVAITWVPGATPPATATKPTLAWKDDGGCDATSGAGVSNISGLTATP